MQKQKKDEQICSSNHVLCFPNQYLFLLGTHAVYCVSKKSPSPNMVKVRSCDCILDIESEYKGCMPLDFQI